MTSRLAAALACCATPLLGGCFLFGTPNKDPLKDLTIEVSWYEGDTRNILPAGETALTMKSDRDLYFNLSDSQGITKVETQKVVSGATSTCELRTNFDSVRTADYDWPASNSEYTITAFTEAAQKSFGPFTVTVQPPNELINGQAGLSDQGSGDGNSRSLFVSRVFGWSGKGGRVDWEVYLVGETGRLIDFATLKVGTTLKAVSPHQIQSTYHFAVLDQACGFLTTTFELYTGTLDPSMPTKPTLAELRALPDPPAGATTLDLANNIKFVYRTGDGKKGLIKVTTVTTSGTGTMSAAFYYSAEQ